MSNNESPMSMRSSLKSPNENKAIDLAALFGGGKMNQGKQQNKNPKKNERKKSVALDSIKNSII